MIRLQRIAVLLFVALLAAGCEVRWKGEWGGGIGDSSVYGQAEVRYDGFPISGAVVRVDGPARRQTTTTRSGTFSISGLPDGRYTVTLRALHGSYSTSLWVSGVGTVNWRIEPAGYDRDLFHQISGLKQYYVDSKRRLVWDYGRLVRWEQPVIRVYMDVAAAPHGFNPAWPDIYWKEIERWEDVLKGRVDFRRVYREADADLLVRWQPQGFLGDHAGIARHLAYYENGAIKRVLIEIDVGYGGASGLWAHELAHAMGIDHVTERSSVMYPYMEPGQRTTLSQKEREHVRLMYDIPSGQRLVGGYQMTLLSNAAQEASGESPELEGAEPADDGNESTLTPDLVTGYRGHVMSRDGAHVELDEDEAAWLMGM